MNWDELKKIVSSSDKIIIVDDKGEPSFVVTTFDYYKKHFTLPDSKSADKDQNNQDKDKEKSIHEDDLSIDDLPF